MASLGFPESLTSYCHLRELSPNETERPLAGQAPGRDIGAKRPTRCDKELAFCYFVTYPVLDLEDGAKMTNGPPPSILPALLAVLVLGCNQPTSPSVEHGSGIGPTPHPQEQWSRWDGLPLSISGDRFSGTLFIEPKWDDMAPLTEGKSTMNRFGVPASPKIGFYIASTQDQTALRLKILYKYPFHTYSTTQDDALAPVTSVFFLIDDKYRFAIDDMPSSRTSRYFKDRQFDTLAVLDQNAIVQLLSSEQVEVRILVRDGRETTNIDVFFNPQHMLAMKTILARYYASTYGQEFFFPPNLSPEDFKTRQETSRQ